MRSGQKLFLPADCRGVFSLAPKHDVEGREQGVHTSLGGKWLTEVLYQPLLC